MYEHTHTILSQGTQRGFPWVVLNEKSMCKEQIEYEWFSLAAGSLSRLISTSRRRRKNVIQLTAPKGCWNFTPKYCCSIIKTKTQTKPIFLIRFHARPVTSPTRRGRKGANTPRGQYPWKNRHFYFSTTVADIFEKINGTTGRWILFCLSYPIYISSIIYYNTLLCKHTSI